MRQIDLNGPAPGGVGTSLKVTYKLCRRPLFHHNFHFSSNKLITALDNMLLFHDVIFCIRNITQCGFSKISSCNA